MCTLSILKCFEGPVVCEHHPPVMYKIIFFVKSFIPKQRAIPGSDTRTGWIAGTFKE